MGNKNGFKTWYVMSFAFQLGFLIIIPIAGFIFLGIWSDTIFQSSPFSLIIGIIVGIGITAYEIYHLLKPFIKNNHD